MQKYCKNKELPLQINKHVIHTREIVHTLSEMAQFWLYAKVLISLLWFNNMLQVFYIMGRLNATLILWMKSKGFAVWYHLSMYKEIGIYCTITGWSFSFKWKSNCNNPLEDEFIRQLREISKIHLILGNINLDIWWSKLSKYYVYTTFSLLKSL